MREVQLLPLYTDSSAKGEAFPSRFSNEICTVGAEVKSTVPAPFLGHISEVTHAEVRGHWSRNVPVITGARLGAGRMFAGKGWAGEWWWFFPLISFQILSR